MTNTIGKLEVIKIVKWYCPGCFKRNEVEVNINSQQNDLESLTDITCMSCEEMYDLTLEETKPNDNILKKEDKYRSLLKQVKPKMSDDELGALYMAISDALYG